MDVDKPSTGGKETQWVFIGGLSRNVKEQVMMDLLEKGSVKLQDPSEAYFVNSNSCHLKASSVEGARKFAQKFNGKELKQNNGNPLTVRMMKGFKPQRGAFEGSNTVRMYNLKPSVTEKQLAEHIRKISKKKPKFLEIRQHSKKEYPSYAIVQMDTAKDAEKVLGDLKMKEIEGQKVWIRRTKEWREIRGEFNKGKVQKVILRHLPIGTKEGEIKKLCSEHGDVQKVEMNCDDSGRYWTRSAFVTMSNEEEASSVFDALHQKKVKGCTISTALFMANGRANQLWISWFPKTVTKEDVYEFVGKAVNERPLRVRLIDSKADSGRAAAVAFSGFDLLTQCISKLNGKKLGRAEVTVGINLRNYDLRGQSKRVQMSNLPRKVTEQNVADHLRKHSKISNPPVSITLQEQGAIIVMKSHEDAMKAVQNVTMTKMKGSTCFVEMIKAPGKRRMPSGKSAAKKKSKKGSFSGGSKMKGSKARLKKKAIKGKGKKKGGAKK